MDVPIANDRMLTGVKEARFQDTQIQHDRINNPPGEVTT